MTDRTRIRIDDDQFERLATIKDKHGISWRGLLYLGAQRLETGPTLHTHDQHEDQHCE